MFASRAACLKVPAGLRVCALAALLTSLSCARNSDQASEVAPLRTLDSELSTAESENSSAGVVPPPGSSSVPPSAQCEERSVVFRKLVDSCFLDRDLCGEVLSVAFDQDGAAIAARFPGELSTAAEPRARSVLTCVRGHFPQLSGLCTKSTTVQFKQSCTLR